VSGPTLEDAFLAVSAASHYGLAEQARGGGGSEEIDTIEDNAAEEVETRDVSAYSPIPSTNDVTSLSSSSSSTPPPRATSRMVKALCVKNMTLIGRARGLCLCQLLTPLLILGLLLTLEELLKVEVGLTAIFVTPPIYLPLNVPLADFEGNGRGVTEGGGASSLRRALGAYALASGEAGDAWTSTASFHEILASTAATPAPLSALRGTSCMQFYLVAIDAAPGVNASLLSSSVGALPRGAIPGSPPLYPPNKSINASGLLSHVPSFWCPLNNNSVTPAPFFDARPGVSPSNIDDELMTDLLVLNSVDSNLLSKAPPCSADPAIACPAFILPDGAWIIEELTTEALLATLQVNSAGSTSYHRPNGVSRPPPPAPSVVLLDAARLGSLDLVTRAYASWAGEASGGPPLAMPALSIAASQAELHTQTLSDVVEIIGGVLFVILLSAPLPLFVFIQVTEKELRLDEMQLSMGVQPGPAAFVNFGVNAGIYACIVALFWATAGGYMQLRVMAHTSPLLLGATFIGHGLALVTTGALVSAFLWDRQVATVLGVILGIVSPLIATSIMAGVYGRTLPWSLDTTPPPALYAIPILGIQLALARILYLATYSALAFHAPLTSASLDPSTDEVGVAVLALYLAAAGNALAAAYFERTLPRRYGTPSHPLFCLPRGVVKNVDAVVTKMTDIIFRRGGSSSSQVANKNRVKIPALSLQAQDSDSKDDNEEEEGEGLDGVHNKKSEFSYASRWAAAAGLSTSAAINSYARGEDADVGAARKQVDEDLWPAAQRDPARVGEAYPVLIRALRKEWELAASSKRTVGGGGGAGGKKVFGANGDAAPLLSVIGDGEGDGTNNNTASTVTTSTSRLAAPYFEAEQRALLSRGTKVAVSDLTLAIPAGACFGLLGENGAGKSSTVAMLQGLHVPTAGSAFVGGHDIRTEQAAVRLSLGVVPQHDVLWPSLTIAEHVLFYARVKGVSAAAEAGAVRAMLRRVGLYDVAARAADALSGGMRRRLSIACAMIGSPRVVLLDELTTGLDPASRRAVWRVVDAARRAQPKAVTLVISHDMNEVEALCSGGGSSCAIMTHGRVRALGTVQHLRELYGDGALLRIGFAGARETTAGDAADVTVGAVEATEAWAIACAKVGALFPKGAGSARVDGHVFQTRAIRAAASSGSSNDGEMVTVKEAGTACFVLDVGPAASGASVTLAEAFRRLREGAASGGINSWAIEAQTLEAVFARVVRHYKA
jgi:ABC-type multidrug transport system ATPase subunit